ncbi:LysM peptidoglycan-binding domain-containing protein [Deferrisoma camini]|uniref:LysM peptidoglycan-binding domain-containing protein n=1 Tax=Deferrisoma camini TaxID=1035120 RepID=UPI00046C9B80|nr:LysM domain-containing protein [Deferrisoma camini]
MRLRWAGWLTALALAVSAAAAEEAPPAPGTTIRLQRTLSVERRGNRSVFSETRRIRPGESLWKILRKEYRVDPEAMAAFVAAFRELNPGVDPDRLRPGQTVKVPFKIEERIQSAENAAAAEAYTVRPGDSVWKILKSRYGVTRDRMPQALAAVARANPRIRDLNRLYVGQRLRIPPDLVRASGARTPPPFEVPAFHASILRTLEALGCRVTDTGETFLPLGRGRTLRLPAADFPLVTGPSGRRVLLDPARRLAPALAREVETAWGYRVVQGVDPDPETRLGRLLPLLGFYEITEGARTVSLGDGAELLVLARWSVVPRPEDLWEGKIYVFLRAGARVPPPLAAELRRLGMEIHRLGPAPAAASSPAGEPLRPAVLPMADRAAGAGRLLSLLGVPHRVRPDLDLSLGGGVRYRVRPELWFRWEGLEYSVPPAGAARIEALLRRAGQFTMPWPPGAAPIAVLRDLLALLGVAHVQTTVEVPKADAVRLRVPGIVLDDPRLTGRVYPARAAGEKLFLAQARLSPDLWALLRTQGLLPWVIEP